MAKITCTPDTIEVEVLGLVGREGWSVMITVNTADSIIQRRLTPENARELAIALNEAADEAEA